MPPTTFKPFRAMACRLKETQMVGWYCTCVPTELPLKFNASKSFSFHSLPHEHRSRQTPRTRGPHTREITSPRTSGRGMAANGSILPRVPFGASSIGTQQPQFFRGRVCGFAHKGSTLFCPFKLAIKISHSEANQGCLFWCCDAEQTKGHERHGWQGWVTEEERKEAERQGVQFDGCRIKEWANTSESSSGTNFQQPRGERRDFNGGTGQQGANSTGFVFAGTAQGGSSKRMVLSVPSAPVQSTVQQEAHVQYPEHGDSDHSASTGVHRLVYQQIKAIREQLEGQRKAAEQTDILLKGLTQMVLAINVTLDKLLEEAKEIAEEEEEAEDPDVIMSDQEDTHTPPPTTKPMTTRRSARKN